jgi:hypothetical protein
VIDTLDPTPEDADADGLHDRWETIYFGDILLVTDAATDWDGDGFNNFAEFAFGMNPKVADQSPLRAMWLVKSGSQNWCYIRYSRHILAVRMAKYSYEASESLDEWQNVTPDVEEVEPLTNEGGSVEVVTVRHLLNSPMPRREFFRVRAERLQ